MISIIRGDDIAINVTCKDSLTGVPINITGYSVFLTVKRHPNEQDANALIAKKVTSHISPTDGMTKVTLSNIETNIEEGDYIYDFQLVDSGGLVSSSQRDTFVVRQDITTRTT